MPATRPTVAAHQFMRYENTAIHRMLPVNVQMKNSRLSWTQQRRLVVTELGLSMRWVSRYCNMNTLSF